jgi:uridine phosphorylase
LTPYLRPTAPIAAEVLLPADPGLGMELAQRLMIKPLMANHHHGLWGYSGRTEAGHDLTIQATGIGGPSAAAVAAELVGHGALRLIRIGECAALDQALAEGQTVIVTSALGADGTSAAIGVEMARPDAELTERLAGAGRAAEVASFDLGAGAGPAMREKWVEAGIAAVDLETAALFAVAEQLGVAAAAALVVTRTTTADEGDEGAVREALLELGEAAAEALAIDKSRSTRAVPG